MPEFPLTEIYKEQIVEAKKLKDENKNKQFITKSDDI